ncbi:hypothetical protein [Pseudanabaena sp. PCC 6802]|uniref:hypothetical protein n=1 Tax=Pseudanabaena sp. PCC 6802 TaxID=118173 RepID=UPI000374EA96|nr:hypothetical protein [Pseudanabaena sp. PCC 6802]
MDYPVVQDVVQSSSNGHNSFAPEQILDYVERMDYPTDYPVVQDEIQEGKEIQGLWTTRTTSLKEKIPDLKSEGVSLNEPKRPDSEAIEDAEEF